MIRPHKLLVLLLVAGSVSCGKSSKPTAPGGSDGWVQVSSPGGFGAYSLAVIGTSLFAATSGGVFRSTDNAAGWTALTMNGLPAFALAVNGTSMFAATWQSGGVFRSTDNGVNWTPVNNGLTTLDIRKLVVSGSSLFAGINEGGNPPSIRVFRSTDDGASWTVVNNGLTATDLSVLGASGTSLFAGTYEHGVFRSIDNGENWTAVNIDTTADNVWVYAIAASGTSLFAGTDVLVTNAWTGRVYRSTDDGASWLAAEKGMEGNRVLTFETSGTSLFAGTGLGGTYRSTDNGANWAPFSTGMPATTIDIYDMAVIGTNLFACGQYFDWSGSTWRPAFWRRSP